MEGGRRHVFSLTRERPLLARASLGDICVKGEADGWVGYGPTARKPFGKVPMKGVHQGGPRAHLSTFSNVRLTRIIPFRRVRDTGRND